MPMRAIPLFLLCLGLAACGGVADRYGASDGAVAPALAPRDADWSTAQAVTVHLESFDFDPDILTFRAGRPYALTLVNDSGSTHTFTAPGFFRAIAVRSLSGGDGGGALPGDRPLESIALAPGETRRLDFVPVRPGGYALECERPLHAVFGMTGMLRIE